MTIFGEILKQYDFFLSKLVVQIKLHIICRT